MNTHVKRMPQRTCVACRRIRPKRELVRLVRLADGTVGVDISGKTAGRGAYLCRDHDCWEMGLKDGRLEHVLRTSITGENRDQLSDFGQSIWRSTS